MDEVQRYARFVQVKQVLTRAQDYLLVGVDVAKATHYACFMRSTGELLLKRFAFDNTQAGFTTFVNRVRDYQKGASYRGSWHRGDWSARPTRGASPPTTRTTPSAV